MKILLTGGSGTLGKDLSRRLLEQHHQITFLGRREPEIPSVHRAQTRFIRCDLSVPLPTDTSFRDPHDAVIHLAADLRFLGPKRDLYQTNVFGTRQALMLAGMVKAKRFIFASSIEAIGPGESTIPQTEAASSRSLTNYGRSKWLAEKQVQEFHLSECEKTILRIGTIYGPEAPGFVLPIAEALRKRTFFFKALPLIGNQFWQPLFLTDATAAFQQALATHHPGGLFHLIGPEQVSLNDVFSMIAREIDVIMPVSIECSATAKWELGLRKWWNRLLKKGTWLTYFSSAPPERPHRLFSHERMNSIWGFSPSTTFTQGLPLTIRWLLEKGYLR